MTMRIFAGRIVLKRIAILIFACVALLFGCGPDDPIRIGFVASITGRLADTGISSRDAVQLAVEQCNEQGGIRGIRVKLTIRDDHWNIEAGKNAVRELIEEGVGAIVGPLTSNIATAVVPYLNESRVIAIGPTVTTTQLAGLDDYFFRVCLTVREYAYQSARYQLRSGNMKNIAVAYDGSHQAFCEDWLENFKKTFVPGGGKILRLVEFKSNTVPFFSKVAGRLLKTDADGILIIANPMDSALLCQQIRKSNPSIKITLSNWAASPRFIEMGGRAVEGVTVSSAVLSKSPGKPFQTFQKIYFERFQREPDYTAILSYDATRIILTALKNRNRGQSLKEALLSIKEFHGLKGKIQLDSNGDVMSSNALIWIVRNRKFVGAE
ncbi:ABC transporter substrate-binding protein [Desulfospira joergensenii]|uniref:ABC transporter substrate-binding protein n=1 Tax=Desulfospira joergensenii TaxID=53329 RepID=UPI0003B73301|nr:ABC transporter substrate-binding protein [Desulfospira joergensenii]